MSNYRGKYPNKIKSVYTKGGEYFAQLNSGLSYRLSAGECGGVLPVPGQTLTAQQMLYPELKTWDVRIQLGAWVAIVPVQSATAKEAHALVLDAAQSATGIPNAQVRP